VLHVTPQKSLQAFDRKALHSGVLPIKQNPIFSLFDYLTSPPSLRKSLFSGLSSRFEAHQLDSQLLDWFSGSQSICL
jgi:hypothetical protein